MPAVSSSMVVVLFFACACSSRKLHCHFPVDASSLAARLRNAVSDSEKLTSSNRVSPDVGASAGEARLREVDTSAPVQSRTDKSGWGQAVVGARAVSFQWIDDLEIERFVFCQVTSTRRERR